VAYWHGFKQYAVDLGLTVRAKLGLTAFDRLDLAALAAHYKVPVLGFDQLGCPAEALRHFTGERWRGVSGYLLPVDGEMAVVFNPSHPKSRIRSTITHEFAHLILNHEFSVLVTGEEGCAFGDEDQEDEAKWLGAELLLPREAAKRAVLRGVSLEQLSENFDVSVELARWRMNVCGGWTILQRARRR
jgi:hypothetical protein